MSEQTTGSGNKNVVLICGEPNTGKSTSLMLLRNQEKMAYLNCDLKELPFKSKFAVNVEVSDAYNVLDFIDEIEGQPGIEGGVLDTITFLMQMFERQYVSTAKDTQKAWGNYGNFYRDLIHRLKSGTKDYAVLAHVDTVYNETKMAMDSKVPIKGAVGKVGIEADFTTILTTKQMPIKKLEGFENDLLHISDDEKEDGFKYVFVTRVSKDSVGEKMRSAMGLWTRKELYIDNDLNQVFARLKQYYGS